MAALSDLADVLIRDVNASRTHVGIMEIQAHLMHHNPYDLVKTEEPSTPPKSKSTCEFQSKCVLGVSRGSISVIWSAWN
ncbi:unnamed protein product [Cylicostephanus goldi]|uniref:Uncharacterized protein n=1 Tax=Cylicostephanus goldi TaxID=71465 RepID=A0A3P6T927_CYLGO|nr:unnamed protein product [Cylicostephanus goldi]